MFEPQDYPNNFEYPGGPPIPPADATGYTPAFQMGVGFDRVLDAVEVPSERISKTLSFVPGRISGAGDAGFLIGHGANNAFILTNRLLKAGQPVFWLNDPVAVAGRPAERGAIWIPASAASRRIVEAAVGELGLNADRIDTAPVGDRIAVRAPRIALADNYGGLMPTGWMRWIFDQYEFPYTIVYPKALDAGKLKQKYDVVILPDPAFLYRAPGDDGGMYRGGGQKQPSPDKIPAQYHAWLGSITGDKTVPRLTEFVKQGGALVAIGRSAQSVASAMQLPVEDALAEKKGGKTARPPRTEFYVPGALLKASVDTRAPLNWGLPDTVDLFFNDSPVFRPTAQGDGKVRVPVKFEGDQVLRSGWAYGQERLNGAGAAVEVPVGKGTVTLFGPEIALRAQTQGAFKLLFNAIYLGAADAPE